MEDASAVMTALGQVKHPEKVSAQLPAVRTRRDTGEGVLAVESKHPPGRGAPGR